MIDRKLEIFRMAAQLRNFTEAAAALGMTQPNVTHQLALLEKDSPRRGKRWPRSANSFSPTRKNSSAPSNVRPPESAVTASAAPSRRAAICCRGSWRNI